MLSLYKNKTRVPQRFGLLSQLGPASKPFQIMSIDTIGGFAGNRSPKKYLHLLVDHFTRFAYVLTSKTQKAPDFIRLLNFVLDKGNRIGTLLADQYTGINSVEFKFFLKKNNVKLVFTAVDCPFSNGLNERLNQTLVNRLRCKINENLENKKRPWSILVNECVKEYNDSIHTVTNFSPNYLLNNVRFKVCPDSVINVTNTLENDRKTAFLNSQKSHLSNKKRYDRNRKFFNFKKGDLVYVNHGNPLNKNKLEEIRTGPYRVLDRLSNSIFLVDSGFQKRESNIYHISKLYPYFGP